MDLPAIPNPFGSKLLLGGNEEIKILIAGAIPYVRSSILIISNQRVIVYGDEQGQILKEEDLQTLKGVSLVKSLLIKKKIFPALKFYLARETVIFVIAKIVPAGLSPSSVVETIVSLRMKEGLGNEMKTNQDFTWLSSLLRNGGIIVTSVKCPSCGASLDIPSDGVYAKCKFCGRVAHITEVIDILQAVV